MPLRLAIKKLPLIGYVMESAWRKLTRRRDLAFTLLSQPNLRRDAQVVKIGANDGTTGDPIAQLLVRCPSMRCVFVEPLPHLLASARQHWGEQARFIYVQAAINDGRPAFFHYVDPSAKTQLAHLAIDPDQLGSFDRQHILKHPDGPRLEPFLRVLPVEGMTLAALFQHVHLPRLDILHIDTEGWDWIILAQLDLERWQPHHIVLEHIHLTPEAKAAAIARLSPRYKLETYGTDWLCTRRDPRPATT